MAVSRPGKTKKKDVYKEAGTRGEKIKNLKKKRKGNCENGTQERTDILGSSKTDINKRKRGGKVATPRKSHQSEGI